MRKMAVTGAVFVLASLGLAEGGLAGADPVRQEAVIELAGVVEEGCEEPILLTQGHAVESVQEFVDGNGRTHFLFRFRTVGVEGVGLQSGAVYRDHSHGTQTGVASIEEGFATGGFTMHARISSAAGQAATLVVRWTFHIVKRDGVNRIFMDRFTMTCR